MRVLATRRLPGPAWDELADVHIGLPESDAEAEALVVLVLYALGIVGLVLISRS